MLKTFMESLCAGVLIAIGGSVFLACENRYVGAILFSVALLCICYKGYVLFTGKVGYVVEDHSRDNLIRLIIGLVGNLICTFLLGMLIRYCIVNLGEQATVICTAKLEQTAFSTFVRGCFCGVLMYLAVSIFKESKTPMGILFGIPVFILSGFEHSIADMFYFGASGLIGPDVALFITLVVLGNSVGGILLPLLTLGGRKKANES